MICVDPDPVVTKYVDLAPDPKPLVVTHTMIYQSLVIFALFETIFNSLPIGL